MKTEMIDWFRKRLETVAHFTLSGPAVNSKGRYLLSDDVFAAIDEVDARFKDPVLLKDGDFSRVCHGTHIIQYAPEIFIWFDEAGLVGGVDYSLEAAKQSLKRYSEYLDQPKPHIDDESVDAFALVMKAKMKKSREDKDRAGWEDCHPAYLSNLLWEHLHKGDPVDVANFAMMLSTLGAKIGPQPNSPREALVVAGVAYTHDLEHDNGVDRDYRTTTDWYEGKDLPKDAKDVTFLYEFVKVR